MRVDLKDKTVIITGCSGGIGSETARIFAENGAFIYVCDINDEPGIKLTEEINASGGKAKYMHCDVRSDADCRAIVEDAVAERGGVDILIHNAGFNVVIDKRGKIRDYKDDGWDLSIDICMDGMYNLNKYALPFMKKNGYGRIINTGSVTGLRMGLRNQCAYNMAKAAIHNMTRNLAIEYAEFGITVNCIIPGSTWHKQFFESVAYNDELRAKFLTHIPLKTPNLPEDIANGSLFLCSPEADRITGVLLNPDGGWAAGYCRG